MANPPPSPKLDITVRVGCSLVYEVSGSAMLLKGVVFGGFAFRRSDS